MRGRLIFASVFIFLLLILFCPQTHAENCVSNWVSPNPDEIINSSIVWQQSLPAGCFGGCAKIRVTLQVINYNDAGALDLYCSNTNKIIVGDPTAVFNAPKPGWIGRINVPLTVESPGWKTVTFDFRLPHLDWINDDRTIFIALEGPIYINWPAQFRVASSTIETIAWDADLSVDGDIDGEDLRGFISNFGCSGACRADFNGDGVVDGNDIPYFLDEYGWSGCPFGFYESYDDGFANEWISDNTNVWTVTNGVYKMTGVQPSQPSLKWSYKNLVYLDFSFEGTVKQIEGIDTNAAGLFFRSSSALSSHYNFVITSSGAYSVNKYVSGVYTQLVPWTNSGLIAKGYDKPNWLKVTCIGPSIQFFINGGMVTTLNDNSISGGRSGFIALDSDTDVNVFQFDDALLERK